QPVTLGFVLSAWGQMLARDAAQLSQVMNALDECPLGVGAVSGTSLPIRRERVAELLRFGAITSNGLDTVGDRDFALDFTYAAAALLLETLSVFARGLGGLRFREDRLREGLLDGSTQATDLAERLVQRGVPFRDAYRAVGALVQRARAKGSTLSQMRAVDLEG